MGMFEVVAEQKAGGFVEIFPSESKPHSWQGGKGVQVLQVLA